MPQSEREIHLRAWKPGDEEELVGIANNRKIWRNMTDRFPHPYTLRDAAAWIEISKERPQDQRHFAILLDRSIVGGTGFGRLDDLCTKTAEIGYWVAEPWWGLGIAPRALAMATEIAFRDFDFERLQANVLEWNLRSCRVLEKAGYQLEARLKRQAFKDGQVCDQWMYALLRTTTGKVSVKAAAKP
jgi:[ribosomal protein S5]-alanine N-acetyltransferase